MTNPRMAGLLNGASARTSYRVDPTVVLKSFPGPVLILEPDGDVVAANDHAADLLAALRNGALDGLLLACREIAEADKPLIDTIELPAALGGGAFDVTVLPLVNGDGVVGGLLLLARNVTLDRNLRRALVESRQRYKDIVECSGDFAWELDAEGRFAFVSPRGALGHQPEELIGRHPHEFDSEPASDSTETPFVAHQAVERETMWFRAANGHVACLEVSSVPLIDRHGHWAGARGICRNVTRERTQQEALRRARERDRAMAKIIRDVRKEIDLATVLREATRATGLALDGDACWVFLADRAPDHPAARWPADAPAPPAAACAMIEKLVSASPNDSAVTVETLLLAASFDAQRTTAVIAIDRDNGDDGHRRWNSDERLLLTGVANQLGVAIEQATIHEQLQTLSRTDGLTGVLNRRAFLDETGRRLQHARRHKRPATLLFIDLNNFKAINDILGHKRGDEAIVAVAELIQKTSRASDILARVGGDEFALWLEETGADGAQVKVRALVNASAELTRLSASDDKPFGMSIGIAVLDPEHDETLESLMDRADMAMYAAKRDRTQTRFAELQVGETRPQIETDRVDS